MTETETIFKGDTGGPWYVGHELDDGSDADLSANYTCKIKVAGDPAPVERAVTALNGDNTRFIAALTPTETDSLPVGQHVVAIEIENSTLVPPLRAEQHIILTVNEQIVGADYVPEDETEVQRLTREISEVREKRHQLAMGQQVTDVMRDGRRVKYSEMTMKQFNDLIAVLERELAEATAASSGKPRRRAIGIGWAN